MSEICFKIFGTCAVLCIALTILGWCIHTDEIWLIDASIGSIGAFALVIGIISSIWEA